MTAPLTTIFFSVLGFFLPEQLVILLTGVALIVLAGAGRRLAHRIKPAPSIHQTLHGQKPETIG